MNKLKATPPIMLLMKDISMLEHDAATQYKFNRFWAIFWGGMMICLVFFPSLYNGNVSAFIITEVSLWANFATHFGAMSSALAASNTTKTVRDVGATVMDMSDDIDDIHDATDHLDTILPPVV
jgi:cobalamin biosynthesis protein CobD/CbiB